MTRRSRMKIATFNINSIRNRLPRLLAWLASATPDVVCLQELRIHDDEFPEDALRAAGYGAIWRGQRARYNGVAILARGATPIEVRRGLPGDPDDQHARYLEAAIDGVLVGCLYAPNGNPQPGPKFTYKLAWLARLEQAPARRSAGGSRTRAWDPSHRNAPAPSQRAASRGSSGSSRSPWMPTHRGPARDHREVAHAPRVVQVDVAEGHRNTRSRTHGS